MLNPFPDHDHLPFPIEIGIGPTHAPRKPDGRANVQRKITVRAMSTCNGFLFVHPTYPNHDVDSEVVKAGRVIDWTVTHSQTGTMLMTGIPDRRTAMFCAGAVSKLWGWGDNNNHVPQYEHLLRTLPSELCDWIKSWGYKG